MWKGKKCDLVKGRHGHDRNRVFVRFTSFFDEALPRHVQNNVELTLGL
jgi:hypothetical protein